MLTKTVRFAKALTLANGEKVTSVAFSSLVLATGGEPRILSCPGSNLRNIFVLRTVTDANKIAKASKGQCAGCGHASNRLSTCLEMWFSVVLEV